MLGQSPPERAQFVVADVGESPALRQAPLPRVATSTMVPPTAPMSAVKLKGSQFHEPIACRRPETAVRHPPEPATKPIKNDKDSDVARSSC